MLVRPGPSGTRARASHRRRRAGGCRKNLRAALLRLVLRRVGRLQRAARRGRRSRKHSAELVADPVKGVLEHDAVLAPVEPSEVVGHDADLARLRQLQATPLDSPPPPRSPRRSSNSITRAAPALMRLNLLMVAGSYWVRVTL